MNCPACDAKLPSWGEPYPVICRDCDKSICTACAGWTESDIDKNEQPVTQARCFACIGPAVAVVMAEVPNEEEF